MKFKTLERVIRDVACGLRGSSKYITMEHAIRNVMEKKSNYVETDPNDQIVAGTYKTKSFEQSPEAQKLYSSLPKNIDPEAIEQSAILHDKLFDLHKNAVSSGRSTDENMKTANELSNKIKSIAKSLNLEKEHGYIDRIVSDINTHLDTSGNIMDADKLDVEKIAGRFASPAKEQTKEKKDNDIDNSRFAISRSIKGQRKIKIIDAD
jgi:hypothetical protein